MQRIMLRCVILLIHMETHACQICGCAVSNRLNGLLPFYQTGYIGLNYHSSLFRTLHPVSILKPDQVISHEKSKYMDLSLRYRLSKRWQTTLSLPVQRLERREEGVTTSIEGLSDPSLGLTYIVYQPDSNKRKIGQYLSLSAYYKAGLQKYNPDESPYFQIGNGAHSWSAGGLYTLTIKKWIWNTEYMFMHVGTAPGNYHFGNRHSFGQNFYFTYKRRASLILPSLGTLYEVNGVDYVAQVKQDYTGGSVHLFQAGIDFYFKSFQVNCKYSKPVIQKLNEGQTTEGARIRLGFFYYFTQKK